MAPFSFFSLCWTSACEVRAAWKEKPHNIISNAVRIKNAGCCHTHPVTAGRHVGWVHQQEKYSITYHGLQRCLESKGIFPLLSSCPSWPLSVFLWSPSLPLSFLHAPRFPATSQYPSSKGQFHFRSASFFFEPTRLFCSGCSEHPSNNRAPVNSWASL